MARLKGNLFGGSIDACGASLHLQKMNVKKRRCLERERIMGIVALSGARVLHARTSTPIRNWERMSQRCNVLLSKKKMLSD